MMTPRTALILAIACGAVAVSLVAVDLQFGVHVELQENVDGQWTAVTGNFEQRYTPYPAGCPGPELRLVVNNDRLFAFEGPVSISYYDSSLERTVTVLDEVWTIESRGVQDHAFTIPESAFQGNDQNLKAPVYVDVIVDGDYLGTCVEASA